MPTTTDEEERAAAAPAPAPVADEPGPSSSAAAAADASPLPARPSNNKRRRNLRQTRVTAVDDEDDGAEADDANRAKTSSAAPSLDHATLLQDTRALQKQRGRRTGIDTATLLLGSSRDRLKASLAASGAASDAEALAAASKLSATEAALGNTFGAGAGGSASAAVRAREEAEAAADAEAAIYVESRLAAALGRAPRSKRVEGDDDDDDEGGGAGGGEKRNGNSSNDKSSLFEAPREAKLSLLSASTAEADASALEPSGAGLGGDDDARGAVGLVEVALAAEDRLLNIERTEAAKERARAAAAGLAFVSPSRNNNFGDNSDGFRRRDLPASFGGAKKRR